MSSEMFFAFFFPRNNTVLPHVSLQRMLANINEDTAARVSFMPRACHRDCQDILLKSKSKLQCIAACCSALQSYTITRIYGFQTRLPCLYTSCNTLQHTATHCPSPLLLSFFSSSSSSPLPLFHSPLLLLCIYRV